jgi:hypothetical protein
MNTNSTQSSQDQSHPSLADEPFAAAMAALPLMLAERRALIGERLLALAAADRKELLDPGMGDAEFSWWPRGEVGEWPVLEDDAKEPLACGYVGHGAELVILDEYGEHVARWEGEVAYDLVELGRFVRRELNQEDDWCSDDDWCSEWED